MSNIFYDFLIALTLPIPFLAGLKYADDVFGSGAIGKHIIALFRKTNISPPFSKIYARSYELPEYIFGRNIISLRSFAASSLLTLFWISLLIFLLILLHGNKSWIFNEALLNLISAKAFYLIGFCLFIDFISSCATRILFKAGLSESVKIKLLILIISASLSVAIFYSLFSTAKYLFMNVDFPKPEIIGTWLNYPFELQSIQRLTTDAYIIPKGDGTSELVNFNTEVIYAFPEGMILISSMLTSIWILITMMAQLLYKYATTGDVMRGFFWKYSSIKSKPILTLGLFIYMGIRILMLVRIKSAPIRSAQSVLECGLQSCAQLRFLRVGNWPPET